MSKKHTNTISSTKRDISSQGADFFINRPAFLHLNDGAVFTGSAPDWQQGGFTGEVVFNTGMTGYVESLTDPSYTNQILVFTFPLIGNYGVQPGSAESGKIQVAGVVMSEIALHGSHQDSVVQLTDWLKSQNIPFITGVDTRALTKHLRTRGTMPGCISDSPDKPANFDFEPRIVTVPEPVIYNEGQAKKVILVDCGAKENIVRSLQEFPLTVKRVPYNYDYTAEDYDGVLLSNGPGDPTDYQPTIEIARKALAAGKPIFGICLGNQILGLAAGAKTYKLLFGHRGHNQPCMVNADERCYITSQNHSYAIDAKTLPSAWRVLLTNLNDGSVEGIEHTTKPYFSVQFHPEACPGPTDTHWLFDRFYRSLK